MEAKLKQYGEEYNKTQQHEYYFDEIEYIKQLIDNITSYESPQSKPVYNINNAFTPAFISNSVWKKYGVSHYAFDNNRTCFMIIVHCVTMQWTITCI